MTIPFDQIRATLDRSWSDRLLSVLETAPKDEPIVEEVSDTLSDLVDPALTQRLFDIGTDTARDPLVRSRVLTLICDSGLSLEGDELRAWWMSGDVLLQKEALEDAYRTEADYLRPVAQDPLHPLYGHAIDALEIGFDDAEWQRCVTQALSHFDPAIRRRAAELAVWSEPVEAESKLIELANGSDSDVAFRSIRTLGFFRSRAALRALNDLTGHDDRELGDEARESVERLAAEFEGALRRVGEGAARDRLSNWMQPVADVVATHSFDRPFMPFEEDGAEAPTLPLHGQALASALSDTAGCWAEKMRWLEEADWTGQSDSDRRILRGVLLQHPDPIVRKHAARILASWTDIDGLLTLLQDQYVMVRMGAVEHLQSVPPNEEVAAALWPSISGNVVGGDTASDVLDTWKVHAKEDTTDALVELALNDTRTALRWNAVNTLGTEKVHLLLPLLDQPVDVNWSLHSMVLDNLFDRGIRPASTANFARVDNLAVAEAVAKLDTLD